MIAKFLHLPDLGVEAQPDFGQELQRCDSYLVIVRWVGVGIPDALVDDESEQVTFDDILRVLHGQIRHQVVQAVEVLHRVGIEISENLGKHEIHLVSSSRVVADAVDKLLDDLRVLFVSVVQSVEAAVFIVEPPPGKPDHVDVGTHVFAEDSHGLHAEVRHG